MSSLFIRADSIITIYDQRNVTPVRNAIRRETNQPDLPTYGGESVKHTDKTLEETIAYTYRTCDKTQIYMLLLLHCSIKYGREIISKLKL